MALFSGRAPYCRSYPVNSSWCRAAVGQLERDLARLQQLAQIGQAQIDNVLQLLLTQRTEDHDIVHAVEKLRPEALPQQLHHLLPCRVKRRFAVQVLRLQQMRAQVRGHDQHRVLEVHRAALRVRQPPIVEHLQQNVEDIRMRLLDLVEQNHGIRPPAHRLGQLAALVVADISRRRADQPRDGMLLHVLRHVDADHGLLVIEEELRQRPRSLRLAHARWSQEDETSRWGAWGRSARRATGESRWRPCRSASSCPTTRSRSRPSICTSLLHFAFQHLGHRDAGPLAHNLGNVFFVDFLFQHARARLAAAVLFGVQLLQLGFELGKFAVLDCRGALQIAAPRLLFHLKAQRLNLLLHVGQPRNRLALRLPARPQSRGLLPSAPPAPFHGLQPFLRVLVGLPLQRRALDLKRDHAAVRARRSPSAPSQSGSPAMPPPRRPGRWPCPAESGQKCSGARAWPRPRWPSP